MQRIPTKKSKKMKRDSFVFRGEWKEALSGLPSAVRLEVYEAVIEYGTSGTIPALKQMAMLAFNFMKTAIDRDRERYEDAARERSEKARRNATARWSNKDADVCDSMQPHANDATACNCMQPHNEMQPHANDAIYVYDSVSDNKEKVSKETKKKFSPPSVDDVTALCQERGYTATNPSAFVAYYESNGWRVGKNPMRSWESALAGWEVREKERGNATKPTEIGRKEFSRNYEETW